MANSLEEHIENPIEDGENPNDEVDKELELQGTGGNSEMANALEQHFENPIEDGENPKDEMDKELELQGTGGNSEMANALEQHFENPIEDGEKPKDEMDKALELQGIGGNIDSDSDSDGLVDEAPSRRVNTHAQNFQKLLKAPMDQFDINKMDKIPSEMVDEVLHCTFRHLKLKLKIDRVLLRTLHRKQWVVSQLKDTFLERMENEKQTALVQPRSLCHMAKDKIMELFMRATLFQLQEQLGRFEKRVAELKDLQKNQILWKTRSQKLKATGSGGTAQSNEGAGPSSGYKAPTDDTGYIACELRRDIAFLEKSIIASQHYKNHQAEFLKKMREHNKLLCQPLSGVPLLAPNAPPAADPSTSQLVEIMDPECAPKAPILLEERDSILERLVNLKKKLQLVVPGGGQ